MEFDAARHGAMIQKAFSENGVGGLLSFDKVKTFVALTERRLTESETYNLTAIREPDKIAYLHYADCALAAKVLPKNARVIDIGCGAGFPTLPLAVLRPDLRLLAVDATEKKVRYVEETARLLGLQNVTCRVMRAEDGGNDPAEREQYDIAVARAVAELRVLSEITLPFVRVGGSVIALKGKNAAYEVSDAKRALAILGGQIAEVDDTPLHSTVLGEQGRALIRIVKKKKTPAGYPRTWAQITKKPL